MFPCTSGKACLGSATVRGREFGWHRTATLADICETMATRRANRPALDRCPYTVGKRVCVAGSKGHAGPHDWPAKGQATEYPVSPFVQRALAGALPAKITR